MELIAGETAVSIARTRGQLFNVFNVDTEQAYRSTVFGTPTYLLPGSASRKEKNLWVRIAIPIAGNS